MNIKLDTIIFYVKDVKKLQNFYVKNFNLKTIEEDEIWVLLNAGSINIGLHKIGDQYLEKVNLYQEFDNNTKIVFEIDLDIEAARNELISRKVEMREIKTFENYNYWLCDGIDPEGNVFQLKAKKK
jgi:catechol-2,3-dioxygenase